MLFSNIILFERYYNGQIFEANFLENKKKKNCGKVLRSRFLNRYFLLLRVLFPPFYDKVNKLRAFLFTYDARTCIRIITIDVLIHQGDLISIKIIFQNLTSFRLLRFDLN